MAVIFSYNLHAVKLVYTLYFLMAGCLLLVPGLLVYRIGYRKAIMCYCSLFIVGTLFGLFSKGVLLWVILGRILQMFGLSVMPFFSKVLVFQLPRSSIKSLIIMRVIIFNFSGPVFVLALGLVIRYFSWTIGFDMVGIVFMLMLLGLGFFSHEIKVDGLISPINQFKSAFKLFSNYSLLSLMLLILVVVCLTSFISLIYAYVLHVEFHLPVALVGFFPITMSIVSLLSTGFSAVLSKLVARLNDTLIIVIVMLINFSVAIVFMMLNLVSIKAWWIYVVVSAVWVFNQTLLFIFLTHYLGIMLKKLNNNIDANILYFFLYYVIIIVSTLVWSTFETSDFIVPLIALILTTIPIILAFFIPWRQIRSMESRT